ncbi:MAG: DUF917 domain-containing protein [Acidimicrobiales bacterium]
MSGRPGRPLTSIDIDDLAIGAWIIGTGGGGSPHLNHLNTKQLAADGHRFTMIDPTDLADDAQVAVVSTMGAPVVMQERLQDSRDVARAVEVMADYLSRPFDAVMATEIGGSNAFQPLMAAAHLDLPVVDADAMGRAYPEAQMTSFAIAGLQPWPLSLVDPRGVEAVISQVPTWKWMERASRVLTVETGSMAATCKAPRTGAEVKRWGVANSMTMAIELGTAVRLARNEHRDPVEAVIDSARGRRLFGGKIVDVERRTTGGFLRGMARIDGLDGWSGCSVELDFQNEWLVARLDGQPIATVPHLICLLDAESGQAIGTETARYGQRVALVGMTAPELFRSEAGLAYVGPRAMGYDLDPVDPITLDPGLGAGPELGAGPDSRPAIGGDH